MNEQLIADLDTYDGSEENRVAAALQITGDLTKAVRLAGQIRTSPKSKNPYMGAELQKAAGLDGWGQVANVLDRMLQMQPDLAKELDFAGFTNAIPTALGFNVFDLTGPARAQYPTYAPIRTRIPRTTTQGPAHLAKILTGVSGSETGGKADVNPAFAMAVPLAGANLEAARGNAIDYGQADVIIAAKWHALRTGVTWPAFFASQGFQDLRAMAATVLMQSGMILEEKAMCFGRDAVLAAPVLTSGTARNVLAGETGIVGAGGGGTNVYIGVTALGHFGGESAISNIVTVNIAAGATKIIDALIADVTGAYGYKVYASAADAAGADPGAASRWYYGTSGWNQFSIGVAGRLAAGAHAPAADTGSGSADNYRGLFQAIESGPSLGTSITGYSKRLNTMPTGASIAFIQDMFGSMFDSVKADPEELWFNMHQRRDISDIMLASATTAPYRITIERNAQGDMIAGGMVSAVQNQSSLTGRMVPLKTHPWMPRGNALCLSYALPFPTSFGKSDVLEMVGPADFQQVSWAPTTMRYESSLFWFNALALYAPQFCGVVHGIATQSDNTKGSLI